MITAQCGSGQSRRHTPAIASGASGEHAAVGPETTGPDGFGFGRARRHQPGERGFGLGRLGSGALDQAAQGPKRLQSLAATGAVGEVLLHGQRPLQRELAVEVGMERGAGMIDEGFH
jgi:hypothetical protein